MKTRTAVGLAILGVWLVVVGLHVRREYLKPEAVVLAEGASGLAPGSHFYSVRMNGQAIGLASSRLDTVADGFVFEDLLRVEIPAMNTGRPASVRTRARLGRSLQLLDFDFRLDSDMGRFAVGGVARPDSQLELRIEAGGSPQTSTIRLDPSLTLPVALPLRMAAAGRLDVGREYAARVLDPSTMERRSVTLKVAGRDLLTVVDSVVYREPRGLWMPAGWDTIPVWVVEESYGGVTLTSWIDEDGRLVKAESPVGFTLERVPYELAEQAWAAARSNPQLASGYGTIIESTAIAADAELAGAEAADTFTVRLLGVDLEGFDLAGGRQALRGDTLVVRRERVGRAGYSLPYAAGGEPAEELEPTPLIQADDPRIVETARRIAGGSTDPVEVARRLNDWVYGRLRKEIMPSMPSAVQVLEARAGDCNEHTVLYVALARALGLPTRTAVGLVHLRGRFYYHAWPEVWLGEWVAVDPTLGQYPADAFHLRFLTGGLARQVELVRLMGRLELETVSIS